MEKAICISCGKEFERKNSRQVRCRECQKKVDLAKIKASNKRRQENIRKASQKSPKPAVCTVIGTCVYGGSAGSIKCCNYALITGTMRGDAHPIVNGRCDLYRKGRKKREKVHIHIQEPQANKAAAD